MESTQKDIKQLKAASQLAEMNHKADPNNEAKKRAYDKAISEYEKASESESKPEPASAEPTHTAQSEPQSKNTPTQTSNEPKSEHSLEEASIEEIEATLNTKRAEVTHLTGLLRTKKAAKKAQAQDDAEKKQAKEATEAATLAAKAKALADPAVNNGGSNESEDSKKNENPS